MDRTGCGAGVGGRTAQGPPRTGVVHHRVGPVARTRRRARLARPVRGLGSPPHARRVDLPTYAFQHRNYWLEIPKGATSGAAAALGLEDAGHPLLGAAVRPADAETLLFTGVLSLRTHPWLRDHVVAGSVLLPGAAFVELVAHAGDQAGCRLVDDITLQAPLVLPEDGGVRVQVAVGAPDGSGRRPVNVWSRPAGDDTGAPWTRHADGTLRDGGPAAAGTASEPPAADPALWPPQGAEEMDTDALYARMAAVGLEYGPVFRGVRRAWKLGDEVLTEVEVPGEQHADAARFGLHPALLDAALHGVALTGLLPDDGSRRAVLPFSWSGVRLDAVGATALRVRLAPTGRESLALDVADAAGRPVASVGSLTVRQLSEEQLRATGGARTTRCCGWSGRRFRRPPTATRGRGRWPARRMAAGCARRGRCRRRHPARPGLARRGARHRAAARGDRGRPAYGGRRRRAQRRRPPRHRRRRQPQHCRRLRPPPQRQRTRRPRDRPPNPRARPALAGRRAVRRHPPGRRHPRRRRHRRGRDCRTRPTPPYGA